MIHRRSEERDTTAGDPRPSLRRRFRTWRRSRPFWGGLLCMISGAELILIAHGPVQLLIVQGIGGIVSYLISGLLIICGWMIWYRPILRSFFSILAVMLALTSFVTSNLGGFLIGMLLGIIGGSIGYAWTPPRYHRVTAETEDAPADDSSSLADEVFEGAAADTADDTGAPVTADESGAGDTADTGAEKDSRDAADEAAMVRPAE